MRKPLPAPPSLAQYCLATLLLVTTLFTTTTLGSLWNRIDSLDGMLWLHPDLILQTWSNPQYLLAGLQFSLPICLILLAHELGHYLTCRWHGLDVRLPMFLPAPVGFGTFGAFIRIREPLRNRRILFDVGISGPVVGFVVLIPFLFLGIWWSEPAGALPTDGGPYIALGSSLLFTGLTQLIHPELSEGGLLLHPFALAAWLGMLATMLNLLPIGQLDGGHVLYALTGRLQHKTAPVFLAVMILAAVLLGSWGWAVWALLIGVIGIRHPPTGDEHIPLDRLRMRLGWVALAIFLLCFMPTPISLVG